jgi:hypothetical protein
MPKFADYVVTTEAKDIMEKIMTAFPNEYQGFDLDAIHTVITKKKKSKKSVYKLRAAKYPEDTLHDKVYFLEIFDENWKILDDNQKAHLMNRVMMSIPEGAFANSNESYGKLNKHDYETYGKEFKLTGGILNWLEDGSKLPDLYAQGSVNAKI